ncbi:hypothetical protein [Fibrobacter sp.]
MKNRTYNNILALLVNCFFFLAFIGCSESSTAGGTVDDNSIATHQVDSVKVFWDKSHASIGNAEIDSVDYWYEIEFHGTGEEYFAYAVDKPISYCSIRIYWLEFGARMIESLPDGIHLLRTFFLTSDGDDIIYHEKLDDHYSNEIRCEKELVNFENSCKSRGWTEYRHMSDCSKGELHLTCSSSKERLEKDVDEVLKDYGVKMKEQCMGDI